MIKPARWGGLFFVLYLIGMHVRVLFHLGAWSDGVILDRLLYVDGYTFTRGMVKAFGWEVWTLPMD